jgi:hypothetical protein
MIDPSSAYRNCLGDSEFDKVRKIREHQNMLSTRIPPVGLTHVRIVMLRRFHVFLGGLPMFKVASLWAALLLPQKIGEEPDLFFVGFRIRRSDARAFFISISC